MGVPMRLVASRDVISFVKEHIIHRFGIPQTITTDGGSVFISEEFRKFADDTGFKLIRSSPYYAQANRQAEASNQSLCGIVKQVLCCDGLPVLRMSSAVSWRKDYNQPEYMCIRKEFFRKSFGE